LPCIVVAAVVVAAAAAVGGDEMDGCVCNPIVELLIEY